MTTEESLFHAALAKHATERAAFLDAACAGQPHLRAAVEALLAAHEGPGSLLDRPAADLGQTVDSAPGAVVLGATGEHSAQHGEAPRGTTHYQPDAAPGAVIGGRYTLVEKLGEGGMGEIWVAKQTEPVKRKVALKLIKAGMDSKAVLQRFEQERQALALMDHPNIARVLDGGLTADRRPFFVMELVNGLALTRFCDEAKLGIRPRLELFASICQAVQHAHQKGIVHRDLKPANILVTIIDGRPVPKVIDFGVAKATSGRLTDESMSTQFGAVVGTLEYMAPEQASFSGVDIDTRADIYSLGVILYELLTGLRPIDAKRLKKAALTEMIRIIQEEEPSRPSTRLSTDDALPSLAALRQTEPKKLTALLRGELDWVVLKCLEKQRDRRYETANALVRDVQRYLADEPVEARPPSAGYRFGKLLRRNRAAVFTTCLVAMALLIGTIVASWQAVRATNAEAEERAAREKAVKLAGENAKLASEESEARQNAVKLASENAKLAAVERAASTQAKQLATKERGARLMADEATREAEKQLRAARATRFSAQMVQVGQLRESDPVAALRMLHDLDACPFELRDAAWRLSEQACHRRLETTIGVVSGVMALNADGSLLAVVRARTDRATQKNKQYVQLLEVPSGKVHDRLPEHDPEVLIWGITFSADNERLAYWVGTTRRGETPAGPGTVIVWGMKEKKELTRLVGHQGVVSAVAFSPDGKTLASCSFDDTARIWDAASGKVLHTLKGHANHLHDLAYSPDSRFVATGSLDNTVKLWDATTGKLHKTLTASANTGPDFHKPNPDREGNEGILSVDFSPDGRTVALANKNWQVELFDVSSGQSRLILRGYRSPVARVRFHPDGRSVITDGYEGPLKRWDTATGQLLLTLPNDGVFCLSRDGKRLAQRASRRTEILHLDAPLEMASTATPAQHYSSGFRRTSDIVYDKKGDLFALGTGKRILVYDAQTLRLRRTLTGHTRPVSCLALAPDGKTLISASGHYRHLGQGLKEEHMVDRAYDPIEVPVRDVIRLWDITTGKALGTLDADEPIFASIAVSPDGKTLAALSSVKQYGRNVFLSDSTSKLTLWDVPSRKALAVLDQHDFSFAQDLGLVTFSPDGRYLASAVREKISIWNVRERKREHEINAEGATARLVRALVYSPDGNALAVGSNNPRETRIELWSPKTGNRIAELFHDRGASVVTGTGRVIVLSSMSLSFSADGKTLASAIQDSGIRFFDLETRQLRAFIPASASAQSEVVAFSPDNRTLLGAGEARSSTGDLRERRTRLTLWNLAPSRVVAAFPGEYGQFSPDGRTMVLRGNRGLRVWDLERQRVQMALPTYQTSWVSLAFHPNRRVLAIGTSTGTYTERMMDVEGYPMGPWRKKIKGLIELYDLQTGKTLGRIEHGPTLIRMLDYSPDGKRLGFVQYLSDEKARRWIFQVTILDVAQSRVVSTMRPETRRPTSLRFSPDGTTLAVGCHEGSVLLMDANSGKVTRTFKCPTAPIYISFTRDGNRLVTRNFLRDPKTMPGLVWDWRTGKEVQEVVPDYLSNDKLSSDGKFELVDDPAGQQLVDRAWRPPLAVAQRGQGAMTTEGKRGDVEKHR